MARFCPTGAEESIMMSFAYPGGEIASLVSSFASHSSTQTEFSFENGFVRLNRRFYTPTSLTYWKNWEDEKTITFEKGAGFGYDTNKISIFDKVSLGHKKNTAVMTGF